MVRFARTIGVAVLCAVGAMVASPSGVAGAAAAPTAKITSSALFPLYESVGCEFGKSVTVSGTSSTDPDGGALQYEWSSSLGGAPSVDGTSFTFDCDFIRAIQVTLTVRNPAGLEGTESLIVYSDQPPTLELTPRETVANEFPVFAVGDRVTFTATATDPEGGPLKYEWYMDKPAGSVYIEDPTGRTLTISCDMGEALAVGVDVTDQNGLVAQAGSVISCLYRPTAAIDPAPAVPGERTVIPVGTKIEFKPPIRDYTMEYAWRTTGTPGIASTEFSFARTFDKPGEYGVEMYETNELGTAKQWVGYTVIGPPTVAVNPSTPDPRGRLRVPLGSTMTFDGSGSTSPGGGTLSYKWYTTGTSGVAGDGVSFARKFDKAGNFGVQLTVANELGQTATRWVGVTVFKSEPPVVSVTPAPKDPKARMEVTVGKTLTFDGRRSRDPDGGSLTYQWRTTGVRGVAGTANTYSRKFIKAGLYGVELTVVDDEGQSSKRWVGVTVVP